MAGSLVRIVAVVNKSITLGGSVGLCMNTSFWEPEPPLAIMRDLPV